MNKERASTALAALSSQDKYYDNYDLPEELAESITVMITDLLHLAKANDISPNKVIRNAQMNFWDQVDSGNR